MAFSGQAVTAKIIGGRMGTLPLLSNLTSGAAWGQFLGREGLFALYSFVVGAIRSVFWCSDPVDTALASWQGGATAGATNNVLHALLATHLGRRLFPGGFSDPMFAGFVRSASGTVNQVVSRVMWDVAPSPAGCAEGLERLSGMQLVACH